MQKRAVRWLAAALACAIVAFAGTFVALGDAEAAPAAADTAGCRPHERPVRAQADRARSIFTDRLAQGVAVAVTVARGIAHPVADLRDTWVAGAFDMTHQSIGGIYIRLRQVVFMVVKRIHRQQRFAAVPIFGFGLLHIADNESAATFRPQRRLNDWFIKVQAASAGIASEESDSSPPASRSEIMRAARFTSVRMSNR